MFANTIARYLLSIYELSDGGAAVRSVDIANALQVSRASVVKSLNKLSEKGFIHKEYYGNVQLTPLGVRLSNRIFTEYTLLFAFFSKTLCSSPQAARQDAIAALCFFTEENKEHLMQMVLRSSCLRQEMAVQSSQEAFTGGIPLQDLF